MIVDAYTAIDDVRACEVRSADSHLAATTGGLVRVIGGKVDHVWTVLDGLPDTKTNALLVEGEAGSDIWIGTDRGLARAKLTGDALTIVRTFPGAAVRAIARAGGTLYVGTWGEGVQKLATAVATTLTKVPFAVAKGPAARTRVTSLAVLGAELVAGTGAGVLRLHDGVLVAMPLAPLDDLATVFALGVREGRLYVGGISGVVSVGKEGAARSEGKSDVRAFAAVGDELWGAAYGEGALRIGKGAPTVEAGLPPGAKWAQAIGARGETRCLGTAAGLFVKEGKLPWKKLTTGGLPSNDVNAIVRDGDRIWAGTYDRGLAVLASGTWKTVEGDALDDRINALAVNKKGVWVGTTRGLVRIEGAAQTVFGVAGGLPSSDVHALAPLSSGGMLVGTTKGAAIVDGSTVTPLAKKQGLVIDTAWAVAEGPKGMLLVGASTGLYVRATKDAKWKRLSVMSGHLPDDWVTALAVRGTDVFVGTYSGGVSHLSFSGATADEPIASQLGGGYVNLAGLTISGDSLYAATMNGLLSRPLAATGEGGAWKKLAQSALGVDVTGVVAGPDGLWVASRRGLVHTK
ncbi:MAG: two-component regulator propeller domain-containing protein [Polyangiales bacterium]